MLTTLSSNIRRVSKLSSTVVRGFSGGAAHVLPPLPYEKSALAPHISEETLSFHYGKHHQAYVTKLNGFVAADASLASKSLEEIIKSSSGGVFNNAAQIWNHTFYWHSLSPNGGGAPTGKIADAIQRDFGGFDAFQSEFTDNCVNHFGSGWVFLLQDRATGKLRIQQQHDAGCPLTDDSAVPILTCDVWEHAYYVDYRNARPDYVKAFWNLINWDFANQNLA